MQARAEKPPHVPQDLVRDFDFFAFPGSDVDVHAAWKCVQDQSPTLFWTPRNGGHWVATRATDIEQMYSDPEGLSSTTDALPRGAAPFPRPPVETDPPDHAAFRRIIQPEFNPREIRRFEREARRISIELIEGFKAQGGCEFNRDFAKHMPIGIFLSLMRLPQEDAGYLVSFAEQKTRSDLETSLAAHNAIVAYVAEKVAERRRNPGDDMMSRIAVAEVNGRRLTDEEVLAMCGVVMFAGLDTVVSSLGFVMRFLADNPQERRRLCNEPRLIPNAVNEMLRRFSPTNLAREAKHDMEYDGVTLLARDPILLPTCLHGLDERRWDDPMTVDFDRQQIFHLAFGAGPHRCIGNVLALTELNVLLQEWLPRIPDFGIPEHAVVTTASGQVNAVTTLPLSWAHQETRASQPTLRAQRSG